MKKFSLEKVAGKILFGVCCVILAFVFWFIVKLCNLCGLPLEFFKYC